MERMYVYVLHIEDLHADLIIAHDVTLSPRFAKDAFLGFMRSHLY